jgi:cytochrome c
MNGMRAGYFRALGLFGAMAFVASALAQVVLPAAKPPDGTALFKTQCATCHNTNVTDPPRQGPTLFQIAGRKPGSVSGYKYSAGFAKADFVWDDVKLDAWLINPQDVIPGSIMAYKQAKPDIRAAIIAYLKELK